MPEYPASSLLFWLFAATTTTVFWRLTRIVRVSAAGGAALPHPLLRARFLAAWIASVLSAAATPTVMNFVLDSHFDWPSFSGTDQAMLYAGMGVAAFGAVLIAVALFADRSKGRRRCPRCWYDLSATIGMTCPECGKAPRRERALFRTRRRWRGAAWSAPIVLAGLGLVATPIVRSPFGPMAIPSIVLVQLDWPSCEPLHQELWRRLSPGRSELSATPPTWAKDMLRRRCLGMAESSDFRLLNEGVRVLSSVPGWLSRSRLLELLHDTRPQARQIGLRAAGSLFPLDQQVTDDVRAAMNETDTNTVWSAAYALSERSRASPSNMQAFLESAFHPGCSTCTLPAWQNLMNTGTNAEIEAAAETHLTDPAMGGYAGLILLQKYRGHVPAREAVLNALRADTTVDKRVLIWYAFRTSCGDDEMFEAVFGAFAGLPEPECLRPWFALSGPDECFGRFLNRCVQDPALCRGVLSLPRLNTYSIKKALAALKLAALQPIESESDVAALKALIDELTREVQLEESGASPRPAGSGV